MGSSRSDALSSLRAVEDSALNTAACLLAYRWHVALHSQFCDVLLGNLIVIKIHYVELGSNGNSDEEPCTVCVRGSYALFFADAEILAPGTVQSVSALEAPL